MQRGISTLRRSAILGIALLAGCQSPRLVGKNPNGEVLLPSGQALLNRAQTVAFAGRPVDMVASPDHRWLYIKDHRGVVVVDLKSNKVVQELSLSGGTSLHGIRLSPDGKRLYVTNAASALQEGKVQDGRLTWTRRISLPKPAVGGEAYPQGIAILNGGRQAAVALSCGNAIAIVDLISGRTTSTIPVDVAPYEVVPGPRGQLLVTCWAGPVPPGRPTAPSAKTPVEVDERGIGVGGTLCTVDLAAKKVASRVNVGLQPTEVVTWNGLALVTNANSDTISVIDLKSNTVRQSLTVRPAPDLPFGSAPNALALDAKRSRLYVTCGGNNAVAQISLGPKLALHGFLPTGWYPNAVLQIDSKLIVANAKGTGSTRMAKGAAGHSVYDFEGTISVLPKPSDAELRRSSNQVRRDTNIARIRESRAHPTEPGRVPVPVPAKLGDPSVFEHVVYVLKENRTYDQLFGDIPKGNGDLRLCLYGREVTPNHHALAEEFALLDNYYCNGVNSADGHAWSVEGNATAYFEKAFGGWTRSYPFGDDPLAPSSSGFIWDAVLGAGRSFRNYGEFNYSETADPRQTFKVIYDDYVAKSGKVKYTQNIGVERLRTFSHPEYPGWNMKIPDVVRADFFLQELAKFEKEGALPNASIVYLPQDHTSGTSPGSPTPRAQVADNDLALGRVVEGISRSRFWAKTCIFVIEDDPQDGFDHVDGHRSICLVISPYTKRGAVVSELYNQTAVLHTMLRILGVTPMNQAIASSPLMSACFTSKPDLRPYACRPNRIPLDEMNPPAKSLTGPEREWALASARLPLKKPDGIDDDLMNRILWHAAKGTARYPAELAGGHSGRFRDEDDD